MKNNKTLRELIAFIRGHKVHVEVMADRTVKTLHPKLFPYRIYGVAVPDVKRFEKCIKSVALGDYTVRKNSVHGIVVQYAPSVSFDVVVSTLAHEFGHTLLYRKFSQIQLKKMGKLKEEKMAWKVGLKNVPQNLLPPVNAINRIKRQALSTYK